MKQPKREKNLKGEFPKKTKYCATLPPNSWLITCLNVTVEISPFLRRLLIMGALWKTTFGANFKVMAQVTIKRAIYQGDALSPLLICISVKPLSQVINKIWLRTKLTKKWGNHPPLLRDSHRATRQERARHRLFIYSIEITMSFYLEV